VAARQAKTPTEISAPPRCRPGTDDRVKLAKPMAVVKVVNTIARPASDTASATGCAEAPAPPSDAESN
jgi:hypothetical protein